MRKQGSSTHERCERHRKRKKERKKERKTDRKKERKKESEALSETDGLCSSEHGLWGIGFGGSPIGYAGFMSCFKVQGNFLLLCSSNNFVGYSYIYIQIHFQSLIKQRVYPCIYKSIQICFLKLKNKQLRTLHIETNQSPNQFSKKCGASESPASF